MELGSKVFGELVFKYQVTALLSQNQKLNINNTRAARDLFILPDLTEWNKASAEPCDFSV